MAKRTVQNTLRSPADAPLANRQITVKLSVPSFDTGHHEIVSVARTLTDSTGQWSVALEVNADLEPSGSFYTVTEAADLQWTFAVPAGDPAVPVWLRECLISDPQPGVVAVLGGVTGATGPQGPAGAGGPQGPQGEPGLAGAGTDRSALLSGTTAPLSGSGLYPLDGVNDPWRWFPYMVGWVGPAYSVTWHAGDQVGFFPPLPESNEEYALWIGSVTTPTEANDNPGQFYSSVDGQPSTAPISNFGLFRRANAAPIDNTPGVAIADGSGIAFLFQAERDWTGPTAVPDPTFTADLTNLAAVLGPDVVIGDPFPWNEAGDGNDGDFWLDTDAVTLYGPKAGGVWPAGKNIKGFDLEADHFLHGSLFLGPMVYPTAPPLAITGGAEIDAPGFLGPGQVALWYESTEGAPVVHFKGMDSAGAVFVASLPMTPA